MCGLGGYYSKKHWNESRLLAMGAAINHRGPDNTGIYRESIGDWNVGLLHKRLSIIDLSAEANQPMQSEDNTSAISFNGEVYNYRELRHYLKSRYNLVFQTKSDTEVLLKLLDVEGMSGLRHVRGMFAFAYANNKTEELFLVRDRFGVKPLYYAQYEDEFIFCSELKGIIATSANQLEVSKHSLQEYLQFGYVPGASTIYENAFKVKPGHFVKVDLHSGNAIEEPYWKVTDKLFRFQTRDPKQAESALNDGIEYRMVADVPVGMFLSGGYDSTYVTSVLKTENRDLNTFTIGFDDVRINEANFAKEIAAEFGTNHQEFYCKENEALKYIGKMIDVFDEPFGDPSAIPTLMISDKASKYVKVVLSADGGDEIYAGYDKHRWVWKINNLRRSVFGSLFRIGILIFLGFKLDRLIASKNLRTRLLKISELLKSNSIADVLEGVSKYIPDFELGNWIKNPLPKRYSFEEYSSNLSDDFNEMLAIDLATHLPDQILTKVDRATMAFSIEGREPLLDHLGVVASFKYLSREDKFTGSLGKIFLKELTWKRLPKAMMDRPKQGFVVPLRDWMLGPLKSELDRLICAEALDNTLFNVEEILQYKMKFESDQTLSPRKLWHLFIYQSWNEKWNTN